MHLETENALSKSILYVPDEKAKAMPNGKPNNQKGYAR